jgi:hypothetical protein
MHQQTVAWNLCNIFDNHASGLTVYGNIFYKCSNSMGKDTMGVIFANYGIDVVASNNIFIECEIPFGSNENALYYDSWTQAQIDTAQITQWEKTQMINQILGVVTGYSEVGNFLGWGVMMNWNGYNISDPNSTTFGNIQEYGKQITKNGVHLIIVI